MTLAAVAVAVWVAVAPYVWGDLDSLERAVLGPVPGGEDHLGPEGLRRVETLPVFTAGLLSRGYSEEDVARIIGGNALRVLRQVLPAA